MQVSLSGQPGRVQPRGIGCAPSLPRTPTLPKPARPDLIGLIALMLILGVLVGGYFLFPYVQAAMGYQDCIASGRITGC